MAPPRATACGKCGRTHAAEPDRFRKSRRGVGKPWKLHHVCRPCELITEADNRKRHAERKAAGETGDCSEGDGRPVHAGGKCRPCYDKARRETDERECEVPRCTLIPSAHGLCTTHLNRLYREGEPGTAERRRAPNGAGYITSEGYRKIYVADRDTHVSEHRVVMERTIGRELRAQETVHHRNGVRHDNRPENLELWSSSHPSGQRVADKIAWAQEFLAAYLSTDELRSWLAALSDDHPGVTAGSGRGAALD